MTSTFSPISGGFGRVFSSTGIWATDRAAVTGTGGLDGIGYCASNAGDNISRHFLPFDTSSLPDNAVISSAFLRLVSDGVGFANVDTDTIDIVASTQTSDSSLALGDYSKIGTTVFGSLALTSWVNVNLTNNDITLNGTGIAAISLTGHTKLAVRMETDRANSAATGHNTVTWTYATPILSVTYTTPNANGFFVLAR